MKKEESIESFYVDTSLPTKKGYKYFLAKFIKALGTASLLVGLIIFLIYAICTIFKSTLKPQFDLNITLYIAIGCILLALICIIGYLILSHTHLKYIQKLYEDYFNSFKENNPISLQLEQQSFYYIDKQTIHIFQNLEELKQINIDDIEHISFNDDLVKVKPFSKTIYKRYIKKQPTCIGVTFSLKDNKKFIIAINLLLNKYSLEYSKKKKVFYANQEYTFNAFKKLEENLNNINSIKNSPFPIIEKIGKIKIDDMNIENNQKLEKNKQDTNNQIINENNSTPSNNIKMEEPIKVKKDKKIFNFNKKKAK